jgi:predicted ATPase
MREFNRVSVRGFRKLVAIEGLELRPFTVMIGANGVGKTSLLDVFGLLAASAAGKLNDRMGELGGIGSLLTRGVAESVEFDLSMDVPNYPPVQYHLAISPRGPGYAISSETLTQQSKSSCQSPFKHIDSRFDSIHYFDPTAKRLVRPTWEHDPLETSLSQVPKMYQQCEDFRKRVASLAYYAAANFDTARKSPVRLPQQMRPATLPGPAGEELVSCLYYLRELKRDRFEAIKDALRAGFPDFERLDFPPVAAGTLAMTWKDKSFPEPIFLHELSEGMLRFLWLVTLLQSPGLTEVTLIDEPEVSLHPELLRLLVELMREASSRSQLIVATHSDRLVRFLEPREVLVCDAVDGRTQMTWADAMNLNGWIEDYALDELWRLGRVGGRS